MFGIYIERAGNQWWLWSRRGAGPLKSDAGTYTLRKVWEA